MLIKFSDIYQMLKMANIHINGILHIGAHDCEELSDYCENGIMKENIIWIDALTEKVTRARELNIPNVFEAVIKDTEDYTTLYVTNNTQATSIFTLDKCLIYHPQISVTEERQVQTTRLDTFFKKNNLDPYRYNFWNIDIQGGELSALKSAGDLLDNVHALYLEVNIETIYTNCPLIEELEVFLNSKGFIRVAINLTDCKWGDALYIKLS